jgi:DNA topoisomerase-3
MFEPDYGEKDAGGNAVPPDAWCGHMFTEQEKQTLIAGGTVAASDFVSQKNTTFSASVRFGREGGRMRIIPDFGSKPKGRARARK